MKYEGMIYTSAAHSEQATILATTTSTSAVTATYSCLTWDKLLSSSEPIYLKRLSRILNRII